MDHQFSLLPDLRAICNLFPQGQLIHDNPAHRYAAIRTHRRAPPEENVLYLITADSDFDRDRYPWISTEPLSGLAPHILAIGETPQGIMERALGLFDCFRNWELQMNTLCFQNGSLDRLCQLGTEILQNPVCIHDGWFILIGRPAHFSDILSTEFVMTSQRDFLPRAVIDAFSDDSDYLETYATHGAHFWMGTNGSPNSLYVNIWEDTRYLGRLLVLDVDKPISHEDTLVAEALAQRASFLLQSRSLGTLSQASSLDDIIFSLLNGQSANPQELTTLLTTLEWSLEDQYVTIRIQSQRGESHDQKWRMLHNDLFRAFPDGYILMSGEQQMIVLNQTKKSHPLPELHHDLAPLCRDYCLYAGISSPVQGVQELGATYYEAGIALEKAFSLRNEQWIVSFGACTLDYLVNHLPGPLKTRHLIASELVSLQQYDREKGTPYYETLRQFLLCERDIPKTAEALIIHRTTLLYRLKKIQSLLSLNLEDAQTRLALLMSLWTLDHQID